MSLQPQTTVQGRCPHTRVTASGSNDVQERRTCRDCSLTLCMVHYGRAPDEWLLKVLNHVREHRPHLWAEATRRPAAEEDPPAVPAGAVPARAAQVRAAQRDAQDQAGVDPPPEPHPKARSATTRMRTFGSRPTQGASSSAQVVVNLQSPAAEPGFRGPQPDLWDLPDL